MIILDVSSRRRTTAPALRAIMIGVALSLVSAAAHAQAKRPVLRPIEKTNWEQWRNTVPVSGNVRAGVMAQMPGTFDPRARTMTVFLPHPTPPETLPPLLCIEVSGQDGRYTAAREYNIQGYAPGPLELELPTEYSKEIAKYPAGQLAILGRLADSCDAPAKSFVVASWNGQQPDKTILVFLNSRLPTTIVAGRAARAEHEVRCSDLPEPSTAFNLRCEIPLEWFAAPGGPLETSVRTRRGPSFTTLPLPIGWP